MNLILYEILANQNLEVWSRIRKEFFEPPYTEIYYLINRFYKKFDRLPSFEELEIVTRDEKQANYISALKSIEFPEDLDPEIILEAVINEYAQRETLTRLNEYLDDLIFKDVTSIVEDLTTIALDIEEKTEISEHIVHMNEYLTIDQDNIFSRVPLGLNNDFDGWSLGMAPEEFILLGGYRGSGKSVVSANIAASQYLQGNSTLYFSIEMSGRELFNRYLAILSGVPEKHIKSGKLTSDEKMLIARTRAAMTSDGSEDLLQAYMQNKDFESFEQKLIQRPLKPDNQIITIDNSNLTVPQIDATIHSYKSKLEDNLKVVVVDYINQISVHDPYNWQVQIELSKKLKALARKYEIVMVSPFQISEEGKTRFAKGILDSPNWVFNLSPVKDSNQETGAIEFECKKSRGDSDFMNFSSEIHWPTLKIRPQVNRELTKDMMKGKGKRKDIPDLKEDDLTV